MNGPRPGRRVAGRRVPGAGGHGAARSGDRHGGLGRLPGPVAGRAAARERQFGIRDLGGLARGGPRRAHGRGAARRPVLSGRRAGDGSRQGEGPGYIIRGPHAWAYMWRPLAIARRGRRRPGRRASRRRGIRCPATGRQERVPGSASGYTGFPRGASPPALLIKLPISGPLMTFPPAVGYRRVVRVGGDQVQPWAARARARSRSPRPRGRCRPTA